MTESSEKIHQCLILGSGPAGLSAALYAARADLAPIVLSGMDLGGQVSKTDTIDNYPGFPEGIQGPDLVAIFQQQAERFGAEIVFDSATAVDLSQRPYRVTTYGGEYLAETLIIATGASVRELGVPGETEFTGKGVSYCATCDGHFFKEKDLIVVGGGDSALKEGIFLTRFAKSVTIVHRRDELRGGIYLANKAKANPKIQFIWDSVITEIIGDGTVNSVRLKNVKTEQEEIRATDGVFIFIGHDPNTEMFKDQLDVDQNGYLVLDHHMHTNLPGVFAAGEVGDPHFQQVIISAGMGAAAAMEAVEFLEDES
ncbi:MAG TPA: thioredoxin-disulfide reductase [Chloroflexi bacterium]|nr:MAG: thioredoxin-disulfide reductase [Chloroflexota bacterium]HDD54666.1 thioredoxin-disulfide reductase [Chloroflexota bacterium]